MNRGKGFISNKLETLNRELIECRRCPRLVEWRETVASKKRAAYREWKYWGRPVPGFGDPEARLVIVGLAPGAHGSNRTGRMFTGDASGDFLYPALHRAGFASQPEALARDDGLEMKDCYITAIVRCVPPQNRPRLDEIQTCLDWLKRELALLVRCRVYLALGRIAHEGLLRLYGERLSSFPFRHGQIHRLPDGRWLLDSYHVSQQNTRTGRLTESMFDEILEQAKRLLNQG